MRNAAWMAMVLVVTGCAAESKLPAVTPSAASAPLALATGEEPADNKEPADRPPQANGAWVGAAAESELLFTGAREAFLGVWVDVPKVRPSARPKMDVALVIDTSGSMAGQKIESARAAARTFIQNLSDGDIVSLDTFDDTAKTLVPPTTLDVETRSKFLTAISRLGTGGSTNMFDGLNLGEAHVLSAPASHSVRRVVVISDGRANVGPSTPDALGMLAERGLRSRVQVTSLGVGLDYDERTLNALAVRSSGRLYHIGDPREMVATLTREVALLGQTVASDATVEIVPAPGIRIIGAEGVHSEWNGRSFRIPLGALFAGQHREALVRVALDNVEATEGRRPLASVRLVFRDPGDGDLERVQETVARVGFSSSTDAVARSVNDRVKAMATLVDAAKVQIAVAQSINGGDFSTADRDLGLAQRRLEAQAQATTSAPEKKRLSEQAASIGTARTNVARAAAAPKPVQRDEALKMNKSGMSDLGY